MCEPQSHLKQFKLKPNYLYWFKFQFGKFYSHFGHVRWANFNSAIKLPTHKHFISLKYSWICLIFAAKCFYKNNLVHKNQRCVQRTLQKKVLLREIKCSKVGDFIAESCALHNQNRCNGMNLSRQHAVLGGKERDR